MLDIINELIEFPLIKGSAEISVHRDSIGGLESVSSIGLVVTKSANSNCSYLSNSVKELLQNLPCLIDDYSRSLTGSANGVFDDGDCDTYCSNGQWWALNPARRIPSTSILLLMEYTLVRWI